MILVFHDRHILEYKEMLVNPYFRRKLIIFINFHLCVAFIQKNKFMHDFI